MSLLSPVPLHLALNHPRKGYLAVYWPDGKASKYLMTDLRKACPCATCKDLLQQLSSSDSLALMDDKSSIDPSVELIEMTTVGRYALQFTWQDGHNTGIYTYEFLYQRGQELQVSE